MFSNENEQFRDVYVVLEDCPKGWVDEHDCYKEPPKLSEWINRNTELYLRLINYNDKEKASLPRIAGA